MLFVCNATSLLECVDKILDGQSCGTWFSEFAGEDSDSGFKINQYRDAVF